MCRLYALYKRTIVGLTFNEYVLRLYYTTLFDNLERDEKADVVNPKGMRERN